jgi:hypothetical protein
LACCQLDARPAFPAGAGIAQHGTLTAVIRRYAYHGIARETEREPDCLLDGTWLGPDREQLGIELFDQQRSFPTRLLPATAKAQKVGALKRMQSRHQSLSNNQPYVNKMPPACLDIFATPQSDRRAPII